MATKEYFVYFAVASTAESPEAAAIDALKALRASTGECDTYSYSCVACPPAFVDGPDNLARFALQHHFRETCGVNTAGGVWFDDETVCYSMECGLHIASVHYRSLTVTG